MKIHKLKTWPEHFEAIFYGRKKCEIRKNDRDFKVGDWLHLEEWNPITSAYEGRVLSVFVTHMIQGDFGLPPDACVMSIETNPI
jgi:hypothetical protein